MKPIIFSIITLFFVNVIFSSKVFSQSEILINEFLIDPQPQSVEIFNSGTERVDISDWIIDDSGGTTFYTIPKDSTIFPNQCLVFSADFNLNKTSADTVRLITNSQLLIDSFSYKSSSGSGISYFRFPDNNYYWTTGPANLGFYNQTDFSCLITPTLIPTSVPSPTPSPIQPTLTDLPAVTLVEAGPTDFTNIYISEVMVNPFTGEKEWVEIYNDNDFPVSLDDWYVDDLENGGSSPKIFSLEINAKGYGIFNLTSSIFNNDGDSVRLLDYNKNLKDDFEYQKNEQGKTLGRTFFDSDYFCLQEPSKNSANNPCINPSPTIISSVLTGLSPIINASTNSDVPAQSKTDGSIHRNINYPTGAIVKNFESGDVLGISSNTANSNLLLIRCLTFISFSYSLLTIISILFKMKVSYAKSQRLYSSSLRSS